MVFILKMILWLLLGVIGLLLLCILLVLFAPITYKVDAAYDGTAKINAKIRFLIFSVRLKFDQKTKKMEQDIRVAFFRLGRKDTEKADEAVRTVEEMILEDEKYEEDSSEEETSEEESSEDRTSDNIIPDDGTPDIVVSDTKPKPQSETIESSLANEENDLWNNEDETCFQDAVLPEEKKPFEKIRAFFVKVSAWFRRIRGFAVQLTPERIVESVEQKLNELNKKKLRIQKKLERIKKFWNMNCTVKTRAYLKKYIGSVLRHIRPRKIKGWIHYGFDDPCKTGQVTGYLSLMPFVYQKGLSLEPDFYNKVIEGHIYMRGHIQLGYLLRIVLNINIWRTVMATRKLANQK